MNKQRALVIQNSLGARSKKTLNRYCKSLLKDCDNVIFDDKTLELMLKYAKKPIQVEQVRHECNHYGYNQSTKQYAQLKDQLQRFVEPSHASFRWNRNYQEAKAILKKILSKASLSPLCYTQDSDIVDALPKKTTHSGWNYVVTGKKPKGDNLEDIFKRFNSECEQAKINGSFNKPILIGVRTQCSNLYDDEGKLALNEEGRVEVKHKTRLVSMIDMYQIICELKWAKPVQRYLGESVSWYAGGKSDINIQRAISHNRSQYSEWISLDYSKYDQTVPDWGIEDSFDIVKSMFVDIGDEELFEIQKRDFINKVFVDGEGKLWESHKGVPSGSMWTQIIDSIFNMLMILTYMISIGKSMLDFTSLIMGDDNLIFVNGVEKDKLCTYLTKNFGIKVNIDKTSGGNCYKESPEFLSRIWTNQGPYRHPNVLISKLLFPERFRNYGGDVTPEIVFYAYILAYGPGMNEAFKIDEFVYDNKTKLTRAFEKGVEYLPGWLGYAYTYGLIESKGMRAPRGLL